MSSTADLMRLDKVVINGIKYTVKTANVTATTSGNTQIIAAVSGKQITVIAVEMTSDTQLVVKVQDADGTPVVVAGPWYPAARGGLVNSAYKENDTLGTSNTAINVNISANGNVYVKVWYVEQ